MENIVMRERTPISRYEYPEDRFVLYKWAKAPGPGPAPYWWVDAVSRDLTIDIERNGKRMCYRLGHKELEAARLGWRWLVAQAVRQVRRALIDAYRYINEAEKQLIND